jgi:hypothetical protein
MGDRFGIYLGAPCQVAASSVLGRTLTSIDFISVTYNDLAAGHAELNTPSSAHEEFTLVLNV